MTPDSERAKLAQKALRTPDLEWARDLVHGLANGLLAAEAELADAHATLTVSERSRAEYIEETIKARAENERLRWEAELLREARDNWEGRVRAFTEALRPFVRFPRMLSIGSIDNVAEIRVSREIFEAACEALAAAGRGP